MIPTENERRMVSTIGGEAVSMGIAKGAEAHLMAVLTDLYEDREAAVVREYSTNAWDSHVEAGNTGRAIEVCTPTALRPTLTIRDYGVGLDEAGIRAIYSQYGASTKRDSNDATGMLGLGCKSALTYADQFTLTAWKNGKRMMVSVSRDDKGTGVMTILEPPQPDEGETGVEVSIPAHRGNSFARKAAEFFRFWPEGQVLVDGAAPERVEGFELTPELTVIDASRGHGYYETPAYIVMGNVAYPYEFSHDELPLPNRKALVARVPIGAVQFTPSREGLMDTRHTKDAMAKVAADFKAAANAAAEREVASAKSKPEAAQKLLAAMNNLGLPTKVFEQVKFQGATIPYQVEAATNANADLRFWHVEPRRHTYSGRGENPNSRERTLPMSTASGSVWVLGFNNQSWSGPMRTKLGNYLTAHGKLPDGTDPDNLRFILTPDSKVAAGAWLDVTTVKWEDVRAWKDPANTGKGGSGAGKTAGTYPLYDQDGQWHRKFTADDIDTSKPIFWHIKLPGYSTGTWQMLARHFKDCYVVELSSTRVDKFKRNFPMARTVAEGREQMQKEWLAALTQDQRDAIATFSRADRYTLRVLAELPTDTDDPELSALVKLWKVWVKVENAWNQNARNATVKNGTAHPADARTVLKRYPLIPSGAVGRLPATDHVKLYINAAYAAQQKEEGT